MVKFSKELEAQLIPEWKDAFVNYKHLKKLVKKIKFLGRRHSFAATDDAIFGRSVLDMFRTSGFTCQPKLGEEVQGEVESDNDVEEGGDWEEEVSNFMRILDDELQKVNAFYQIKEAEFVERGEALAKQLQILCELKCIISDRRLSRDSSLRSSSHSTLSFVETPDASERTETKSHEETTEGVIAALERNGVNFMGGGANWGPEYKTKKRKPKTTMRIDTPAGGPTTGNGISNSKSLKTISAAMAVLWEDLVNSPQSYGGAAHFINRKKIQFAEKMIRTAYVEFYRGLGLLKTYCSLNMLAFTKILKKFDKVANREESITYLKKVKGKHFGSSDKVVRVMDEVEFVFTEHFADKDRKKAMKFLMPQQQKNSHLLSFLVGLFTGCFVTLFVVYAILAYLSGMFSDNKATYMETIYPIFSMFALLSLHLFMYGCNLYMWKATRINSNFIFDFQSKTALSHRDAFLLCTTSMTALVVALVIHLLLKSGGFSPSRVDVLPACLLLIFMALLICPLNIFYRPTRYCFLRVIRNIVCSPFYQVLMVDFFMADQLTSQIPLLRHLETTTCYFLAGSFKTHHYETCKNNKVYKQLAYVISFSPYYWRAMQCARRWLDESDTAHLVNLGKYVSAMAAAGARLTYTYQPESLVWMIIVLVTSSAATIYQLYWDFVRDWGFLNPSSKNPWLRDNLMLKSKSVYYISIALNVVLRVAWVESVFKLRVGVVESRMLDFSLASLEVIRRGHWNFYRLEHEHLNNVGKLRAEKAVPLPFHDADSDY